MTATKFSPEEIRAALGVIRAVADAVREAGRVPSGVLYAAVNAHGVGLPAYQRVVQSLTDAGLVRVESHELVWTGGIDSPADEN